MIFLVVAFSFGLVTLFLFGKKKIPIPSVSLPGRPEEAAPSQIPLSSSPSPFLQDMENNLKMIGADLGKVKEDSRLNPPQFFFDLKVEKQ